MILALNLIDLKNKIIPEKSLKIIEQIPEETEINDVTNVLNSYIIPYSFMINANLLKFLMITRIS